MEFKDYRTAIKIKSEPEVVYAAITNPLSIELWSGYKAEMPHSAGGEFSMWDGDICGRIIEYRPSEQVVQEWYFGDEEPASTVTLTVSASGDGSRLEVHHTNIPADAFKNIVEGWNEYYLKSLKSFLDD